jgi:hypothetical protein
LGTVALLAARAPRLRRALAAARDAGHDYVVIDGTLISIDRVAADRPFYSGKHRRHGMNLQVISATDGEILWVSGPLPGAVHDLTAARVWGIWSAMARLVRGCPTLDVVYNLVYNIRYKLVSMAHRSAGHGRWGRVRRQVGRCRPPVWCAQRAEGTI